MKMIRASIFFCRSWPFQKSFRRCASLLIYHLFTIPLLSFELLWRSASSRLHLKQIGCHKNRVREGLSQLGEATLLLRVWRWKGWSTGLRKRWGGGWSRSGPWDLLCLKRCWSRSLLRPLKPGRHAPGCWLVFTRLFASLSLVREGHCVENVINEATRLCLLPGRVLLLRLENCDWVVK